MSPAAWGVSIKKDTKDLHAIIIIVFIIIIINFHILVDFSSSILIELSS